MAHTIRIETTISPDRHVEFDLPQDFPVGDASVVLTVTHKVARRKSSGKDILNSDIVGMWADRTDIKDSAEYARNLREQAWKRSN